MGVKLDIEAWFVGTKDTIKREGYGALPGRIGGLVRDARAFYFDEPVVGMVDFGYKEGKGIMRGDNRNQVNKVSDVCPSKARRFSTT